LEELTGNGDITFAQAYTQYGVNLTITYMSLRYQTTLYASWQTQPGMKIKDAIRASSSIALFFKYFQGEMESPSGRLEQDIVTDGGTADNLPIHVLHKQGCLPRSILVLKLVSPEDNSAYEAALRGELHDYGLPRMPIAAAFVVVEALRKTAMRVHVEEEDWKLCVRSNVGNVSSTDFDLTPAQVETLFQAGREGMSKYLGKVQDMLANGTYPE
jgi:NTE family protein